MVLGSFADILFQWDRIGVFDFILPFLLVFAFVFGVTSQMGLFKKQKAVNVIIAVVIGMLAIRFQLFTDFLAIVSPRLGIGLVVMLILLILVGLFAPEKQEYIFGYILMGVGALIFIIIIAQTFDILGYLGYGSGGYNSGDLIGYIVLLVLLAGVIIAVAASGGRRDEKTIPQKIAGLFGGSE